MYTIEKIQQASYTAYKLCDVANNTTMIVTPEKGGMITSITKNNEEYSWLREPNFSLNERPRCAIPVLFPTCGRSNDGKIVINNQSYPIDIHGFAHSQPWEVLSTSTAEGASITLVLTANEETLTYYPFNFKFEITYTLLANKITTTSKITNVDTQEMPFSLGFHPYFKISSVNNLSWNIHAEIEANPDTNEEKPFSSIDFPYHPEQTTRYYKNVSSPISFTDSELNRTITIDFDKHFKNVVLWSQCDLGFVCMEPWNGYPNSINSGDHETLAVNETFVATYGMTF